MKTKNVKEMWSSNKLLVISFVAVLLGSLMLIASVFLPFASARKEYRDYLHEEADQIYVGEINMTNADAVDISLIEFVRMATVAKDIEGSKEYAITTMVIISTYALFTLLTTLFSLLKKPIATAIFSILAFGVFMLNKWDFEDRGVIPSGTYDWGSAEVVCYVGVAIVIIGSILLRAAKKKGECQSSIGDGSVC